MYARYVPPPKAAAQAPPPANEPATASTPASNPPYARYVPPAGETQPETVAPNLAPAQPRKIVFNYDDESKVVETPKPKTPAKDEPGHGERKRKRAKTEATAEEPLKAPEPAPVPVSEDRKDLPKNEKSKKEKEKKKTSKSENKKDQDEDLDVDVEMKDVEEEGDNASSEAEHDSVDARHKALLKKKSKSLKIALKAAEKSEGQDEPYLDEPLAHLAADPEVHGLEPLPQPAPAIMDTAEPTYDTLPSWLQRPIFVSADTTADWATLGLKPELGISPEVATILASKGYPQAFAVQTAVIPRLLPNPGRQGDLVISAATGSGKTLAYVLPMIRDISLGVVTKLRAVIVVPTRELVQQVYDVCNVCAAAYGRLPNRKMVKIGTAVGNQTFKKEMDRLVGQERSYDPDGYRRLLESRQWSNVRRRDVEDPSFDMFQLADTPPPLVNHVYQYVPKVDVLICTPGRLVEHMERTPGFDTDYVRWLVVDEADKLLEQSYQQWLDLVMERLSTNRPGCRDFMLQNKSGVRKLILSATMTRNVDLLGRLRLQRPEMIVLEGGTAPEDAGAGLYELALPELLHEFAVKIRNPEHKPMYLVDLLNSEHLHSKAKPSSQDRPTKPVKKAASDTSSDLDTSPSSESDSDDTLSDPDSPTSATPPKPPTSTPTDTVLIFTKSNESALRLSRLLQLLLPTHTAALIGTLTSAARTSERKRVLRAFAAGRTRVLVASDLVARGLDLPALDHVVNYDVPPSVRSYVHRVGRTARAGREGRAWTFFTKTEAGWFFAEVAGSAGGREGEDRVAIRRSRKVETVRITERRSPEDMKSGVAGDFWEERIKEYEQALETLGKEARGQK